MWCCAPYQRRFPSAVWVLGVRAGGGDAEAAAGAGAAAGSSATPVEGDGAPSKPTGNNTALKKMSNTFFMGGRMRQKEWRVDGAIHRNNSSKAMTLYIHGGVTPGLNNDDIVVRQLCVCVCVCAFSGGWDVDWLVGWRGLVGPSGRLWCRGVAVRSLNSVCLRT